MGKTIESNGDFVQRWINTRRQEGELSQEILGLIELYRSGTSLKEAELLRSLLLLSEQEEIDDTSR